MKENKTTMNAQARTEYEPVSARVVEVETQGVLCASNNGGGSLFGGLDPYSGSAL